jgi:predicted aconitase
MAQLAFEPIDRALLDGEFGPAAAAAMRLLRRYGAVLGAETFVSIQSAHIDGCLYHGPSSIDFVRRFADLAGQVRVPTTLNVAAVDVLHPGWHQGDPDIIDAQQELTRLHEALGCLATLTCAPYQRMIQPLQGEHVAWAESNAIVFANSVLGARTAPACRRHAARSGRSEPPQPLQYGATAPARSQTAQLHECNSAASRARTGAWPCHRAVAAEVG